jgi:hypothetical protein
MTDPLDIIWSFGKNWGLRIIIILAIIAEIIINIPNILAFEFSGLITPFGLAVLLILFEKTISLQEGINNVSNNVNILSDTCNTIKTSIVNPDIEKYSKIDDFLIRLNHIAHYEKITIIGALPINDFDDIKKIIKTSGKDISFYRYVDKSFINEINSVIGFETFIENKVDIHNIDEIINNFIIIGTNQTNAFANIIINFEYNSNEKSILGYNFEGKTASVLSNFIFSIMKKKMQMHGLQLVESTDAAQYIISQRTRYQDKIKSLSEGVPKQGAIDICNCMSDLLHESKKSLDVTHIALGPNIELMEEESFELWLQENYSAAKRGLKIRRILIVSPNNINNPILQKKMIEMKQHFEVKYCLFDTLKQHAIEIKDFSIYDGKHLVYIPDDNPWFENGHDRPSEHEHKPRAKHSTNPEKISQYQQIFDQMFKYSLNFKK